MMRRLSLGISVALMALLFSGCTMMKMGATFMGFDSETQDAYAKMMDVIGETGDPAQAMMLEFAVDPDLTEEGLIGSINSIALEYNMMVVGEKNMFNLADAKPEEVKHARVIELCSLKIAKKMLNHSRFYGGFMPCRIILVEYGNGERYLITMDMTLALYGGTDKKPINEDLFSDMLKVKEAMDNIPKRAARGDF
ncbi:MAG: DUF302 domain-containing protein [Helicobacteraceae bacterium CG2_30_36_10]|nr:MAG: DUF302 domain-containing protein [Helicobacteraceae bacterium CG2_30_36_10]